MLAEENIDRLEKKKKLKSIRHSIEPYPGKLTVH